MTSELNHLTGLASILDTFVPGDASTPRASAVGTAQRLAEWAATNLSPKQRRELDALLSAWTVRAAGAASNAERELLLVSSATCRDHRERITYESLKTVGLLAYLSATESTQTWASSGYPTPAGNTLHTPPPVTPLDIHCDTEINCGVVVVGSGPAAGAAAAVLAASGIDVVVLSAADFGPPRAGLEAWQAVANRFGPIAGMNPDGIAVLKGACSGGEQVVNHTAAFRTPDAIRAEWAELGARQFADHEYGRALDAVCQKLGGTTEPAPNGVPGDVMARGLHELGWHAASIPRSIRGCDAGSVCGHCSAGCPLGAGRPRNTTWLHDATRYGARIALGVIVDEVLIRSGKATGVSARSVDGHAVTVRADAVVAAGGAVNTAALLIRSGLTNPNIGRYLRLHPHLNVFAEYEDDLESWDQSSMPYSAEHSDLDGNGYGVRYVGQPLSPWMLAYGPWTGARAFSYDRSCLRRTSTICVVLRDRGSGRVAAGRGGAPAVHYRVGGIDLDHVRAGVRGAVRIAEAAGAKRIWPQHRRRLEYRPGHDELDGYLRGCTAASRNYGQVAFYTTHQLGTARMGGSPATSATDPDGATWEVRNLVVADGSCFPTATGVNPLISIEAIAYMNANRLASALSGGR